MTFEEYMNAVIDYYMIGGVTWGTAYMRVLENENFELWGIIWNDPSLNPAKDEANLGGFMYYAFTKWRRA